MSKYYNQNMKRWKMPARDLFEAKRYCVGRAEDLIVWEASVASFPHDEKTRRLMIRHVTDPTFSYMHMQLEGFTMSPEYFRVNRAKFYWYVHKFASKMGEFDHLDVNEDDGIMAEQDGEEDDHGI